MANACLMAAEIAAGRIISRHYGQSIYAWTTVIGVILAGMTLGSYLGGRWADRFSPTRTLAVLFGASAIACALVPTITDTIVSSQIFITFSWPVQITLHILVTFGLPSVLLGAVSPVVASMALARGHAAGRTVGSVYAWSSVGSIAGTFLAGFYLVAAAGMNMTLYVVAATLIVMAAIAACRTPRLRIATCLSVLLPIGLFVMPPDVANDPGVVYKTESQYSHILIAQDPDQPNVRQMLLDRLMHSRVNMDDPLDIRYDYEWTYTAVLDRYYPAGKPINAFLIGGGGFIYPHYLEITRPGSYIEVAEIDPEVTKAAHEAFGLPKDTTITIFNMDARNRVDDLLRQKRAGQQVPLFDCIFGDSFNDCSVPYHLTTLEFHHNLRQLLVPDGIYMLNLIDILDSGQFLSAVINTCKSVWPNVYLFSSGSEPQNRDTFVMVCSGRPLELEGLPQQMARQHPYTGRLLSPTEIQNLLKRTGTITLTDNYAPVENMLRPVVQFTEDVAADSLVNLAEQLISEKRYDDAIRHAKRAISVMPKAAKAYETLGYAQSLNGDPDSAIKNLSKAVELDANAKQALSRLARTLYFTGDFERSIEMLKRLEHLDPNHPTLHQQFATVYTAAGQFDEAWTHIHKAQQQGETIHQGVLDQLIQASGRTR